MVLSDGKEVAASRPLHGVASGRRGPDVGGKVTAVAKDGKSLTLDVSFGRPSRGEEPMTEKVLLNDKTILAFHGVGKGGAKMTEGYMAAVSLEDGSKDTAALVDFYGAEPARRRDEKGPDVTGRAVAAAKDGSAVTVEVPSRKRGDDTETIEIKLTGTAIGFHNVVLGGAQIEAGQRVQIWLADGSKDTAGRAAFSSVIPDRYTIVVGKVVAVARDGGSVTLEQPSRDRGEEAKRVEVKITVNTQISFGEIGPNEARIVEGLMARARLVDGSADTAAQIGFGKQGAGRR